MPKKTECRLCKPFACNCARKKYSGPAEKAIEHIQELIRKKSDLQAEIEEIELQIEGIRMVIEGSQ